MSDIEQALFRPDHVSVQDGVLTINVSYPYHIEMKRIASRDDILAWVAHLTEKTWMTQDVICEFIFKAASAADIELPKLP